MQSFYRRPLPSSLTALDSEEGRKRFSECMNEGTAEPFLPLISVFQTQAEPAYCGLATLSMILNALSIDPGRTWKGPWRWYSEELLDCCVPLQMVESQGITLKEFVCLATCNGVQAAVWQKRQSTEFDHTRSAAEQESVKVAQNLVPTSKDISEDHFRDIIKAACSASDPREYGFLVVSYSRKTLGQTGDGHYSPIAAYHESTDSVLILDVARFKYPPYFVSLSTLFASICQLDNSTMAPRGLLLLRRERAIASLYLARLISHENRALAQLYEPGLVHFVRSTRISLRQGLQQWKTKFVEEIGQMDITTSNPPVLEPVVDAYCKTWISELDSTLVLRRTPKCCGCPKDASSTTEVVKQNNVQICESLREELAELQRPGLVFEIVKSSKLYAAIFERSQKGARCCEDVSSACAEALRCLSGESEVPQCVAKLSCLSEPCDIACVGMTVVFAATSIWAIDDALKTAPEDTDNEKAQRQRLLDVLDLLVSESSAQKAMALEVNAVLYTIQSLYTFD